MLEHLSSCFSPIDFKANQMRTRRINDEVIFLVMKIVDSPDYTSELHFGSYPSCGACFPVI